MEYKNFKEIVDKLCYLQKNSLEFYKMGLCLIEREEPYHIIISLFWDEILTKEGKEWLEWFLYEKKWIYGTPDENIKAWEKEGEEICKDLEGLFEYLTRCDYFLK